VPHCLDDDQEPAFLALAFYGRLEVVSPDSAVLVDQQVIEDDQCKVVDGHVE
jgi:hypothetical protein